ncbi:MAG TPA: protein jag [Candidatus Anaerostipes avistercoris]|uniref:RNA-binding protein KhpB n=1 Tax=Candidatus Anaerostipes avistercoris TaxID=2838462 RepID=A0A9D2PHJ7_9FIRM|nr:protein jag [Candidatus Anaerostipes avistercoris]
MSSKRFTGKTESDAVMNAAMELGIPSTDLDYEVIDPGSNGFFGLFKKPAIIEVKEKVKEPEVKKEAAPAPAKPQKQPVKKEKEEKKREKKTERKNSGHHKKTSPKQREASPQKEKKKNKIPENLNEITRSTEKYLDEVLRAMGLNPKLNLYYNRRDNVLNINVSGEKMGALIGKHGQTLDALQYLTSLFVNKKSESYIKIKLDTENYRERRQQTLEKLAGSIAYKVKKNKKPIYLEPMNPNERRIIHSALQRDPDVITKSEGKDPYRKVVVMLKK